MEATSRFHAKMLLEGYRIICDFVDGIYETDDALESFRTMFFQIEATYSGLPMFHIRRVVSGIVPELLGLAVSTDMTRLRYGKDHMIEDEELAEEQKEVRNALLAYGRRYIAPYVMECTP